VSEDASATILDLAATLGVDFIILGAAQRRTLADLLRGSVTTQIAQNLPESIRLMIYG
jgi:nucleotide-binding universal stress UspA family protein